MSNRINEGVRMRTKAELDLTSLKQRMPQLSQEGSQWNKMRSNNHI